MSNIASLASSGRSPTMSGEDLTYTRRAASRQGVIRGAIRLDTPIYLGRLLPICNSGPLRTMNILDLPTPTKAWKLFEC